MVELRRYERTPIDLAVELSRRGSPDRQPARATDISLGGMFVRSASPLAFGTEVVVHMLAPGARAPMAIPAVVRWSRVDGMGLQFGLLGARETHAITELMQSRARRPQPR